MVPGGIWDQQGQYRIHGPEMTVTKKTFLSNY